MKVKIEELGDIEELTYIDARSGVDCTMDFIGNTGAFGREFQWDDKEEVYVISVEDYNWWFYVITEQEEMDELVVQLLKVYDTDEVYKVIEQSTGVDLKFYAIDVINNLYDKFVGKS